MSRRCGAPLGVVAVLAVMFLALLCTDWELR